MTILSYILFNILLKMCISISIPTAMDNENLRPRLKRQAGYVYDRPSVSFELPSKPAQVIIESQGPSVSPPSPVFPQAPIASTQGPTVDRTLAQKMFYAYPVPSGGDTMNIGQISSTAAPTAAPTAAAPAGSSSGGYSYGTSNVAGGYNYDNSAPAQNTNVGPQNLANSQSVSSAGSGYNYGAISSGLQTQTGSQATSNVGASQTAGSYNYNAPTLSGPTEVSTSAPKYLPPSPVGGNIINENFVRSSVNGAPPVSSSQTSSSLTGSGVAPSDQYLPPSSISNTASAGQSVTSVGVQTIIGSSVQAPSANYLPPNPSQLPPPPSSAAGYPSPTGPVTPSQNYLPPGPGSGGQLQKDYLPPNTAQGGASGNVSGPTATYLPVFK